MFKKQIILLPITLLIGIFVFSQEKDLGTEVVEIVKPFTPSVSDAFKIKESPNLTDTTETKKKPVKYGISSIPVASTFTPTKGQAAKVRPSKREKIFDNYARIGFGNYTTLLAELFSNFKINNTDDFGLFLRHNSTQGGIKNLLVDDKFYDTRLDGEYASRGRNATYKIQAGADHQLINWYGINENIGIPESPKQNYFSGYIGGSVSMNDSYFENLQTNIRYLGDSFSSSEFHATLNPEFRFSLSEIDLTLEGDVDYLSGSFKQNYNQAEGLNYNYLNLGLIPAIAFGTDDISISLGVAGYFGMDTKNSNSEFSLYPKVKASYRIDESFLIYAGADGGLKQNSYYNYKEINPFVSPTLFIAPTKSTYDGFAGINGNISNGVGFNLKASYGNEIDKPLFKANPFSFIREEPYQYGNSFQVVYDEVNTLNVFGEIEVDISKIASIGFNVNYFNYKTKAEATAWNLPDIKASVFSEFDIMPEFYGGVSVFFVGERKDFDFGISEEIKLKPYVDANIHFGYRITDQFTAFIKGSNLLSDNYTKWMNYPVQGIQVLAGITYKFDW